MPGTEIEVSLTLGRRQGGKTARRIRESVGEPSNEPKKAKGESLRKPAIELEVCGSGRDLIVNSDELLEPGLEVGGEYSEGSHNFC